MMASGIGSRRRIAVVTWFYDNQPGFLDFKYRIEALGRNYNVTLILRNERFVKEFDAPGLRPKIVAQRGSGTKSLLAYVVQVARLLRADRHDAVILLGAQLAPAVLTLIKHRTVLYWNEHPTHTFHGGRWRQLSRWLSWMLVRLAFASARNAALVMPIGEAHRDDLLANYVDPARVCLIPMGVDDKFAELLTERALHGPRTPLRVIYTGTVAHERGRDVMLEGLAIALRKGVSCHLTLVGASEAEHAYCLRRADALDLGDALTVVGRVAGDAIPAYLAESDVGVCLWEDRVWWRFNPPTKLFEYLAAGLPVLASRIRTHTLYLTDGVDGLIFDYTAEGFAQVLGRLARLRSEYSSLSEEAGRTGAKFLWSRIEPTFLQRVEEIVSRADGLKTIGGQS